MADAAPHRHDHGRPTDKEDVYTTDLRLWTNLSDREDDLLKPATPFVESGEHAPDVPRHAADP